MATPLVRDRDTVEYIDYQFATFTDVDGNPIDSPSNYELSAVPAGTRPTVGDWHAAPWLAGPMTPGTYIVRLRFTDTPEIPVREVAVLTVT